MSISTKPNKSLPDLKFWSRHVKCHEKSQHSQARYCRENKLALSTFRYWEKKLRRNDSRGIPEKKTNKQSHGCDMIDVTDLLRSSVKNPSSPISFLEIEIGKDCRVKVPSNWRLDDLKTILIMIKAIVC